MESEFPAEAQMALSMATHLPDPDRPQSEQIFRFSSALGLSNLSSKVKNTVKVIIKAIQSAQVEAVCISAQK